MLISKIYEEFKEQEKTIVRLQNGQWVYERYSPEQIISEIQIKISGNTITPAKIAHGHY